MRSSSLFGNPTEFGLEVTLRERSGRWCFGTLLLHVCGEAIGDPDDYADLRGCMNWLGSIEPTSDKRRAPSLESAEPAEVFRRLCDDVMAGTDVPTPAFPDAYARFHISHVGMSSWRRYHVLLMKLEDGRNRLLWRESYGAPRDAIIPRGLMDEVISECCEGMQAVLSAGVQGGDV